MEFFHSEVFSSRVEALMNQHHVPGLAIAIVANDQTASTGYGYATIDPPTPCTADTLFDIASCSKSLTAASVALLIDDNENHPEVQYDSIMSDVLPGDFVMPGVGYTENVTVEDVLSHRTGMAAHDCSYFGPRAAQPDDARSITRNLRNLSVAAPLRSRYLYNNMMYTVATYLVETKSKQSFANFLQTRFFDPLNMSSTSLQPGSARARGFGDRIATGYDWEKKKAAYHGFQSPDCPETQGAGSIVTSVNDFIKWVKAFMSRGHPITDNVYQGLVRMRSIVNPNPRWLKPHTSPALYAAGVDVYYYRGYMVVGHNGTIAGFASRFFFLPEFNFGAVIAGNSEGAGSVTSILARELMDKVLNVPEVEHPNKPKAKIARGATKDKPFGDQKAKTKSQGGQPSKNVKEQSKGRETARETSRSGSEILPPREIPLNAYTGNYWHPGYHNFLVEIKDDKLFIDATDRSLGFTLVFNHLRDQTKFSASLTDFLVGGEDLVPAEFVLEDGIAVRMGLKLENSIKDMIWFEKVKDS